MGLLQARIGPCLVSFLLLTAMQIVVLQQDGRISWMTVLINEVWLTDHREHQSCNPISISLCLPPSAVCYIFSKVASHSETLADPGQQWCVQCWAILPERRQAPRTSG